MNSGTAKRALNCRRNLAGTAEPAVYTVVSAGRGRGSAASTMRLDTCRTLSSRPVTWRLAQSSCIDKGGDDRPAGKTNVVPRYMHVRILLFAMDCSIETGVCDR